MKLSIDNCNQGSYNITMNIFGGGIMIKKILFSCSIILCIGFIVSVFAYDRVVICEEAYSEG